MVLIDHIQNYKKIKNHVGYFELSKVFGIDIKKLIILNNLDTYVINRITINKKLVRFYNKDGREIYFENNDGDWISYGYDNWGYRNFYEDSSGFWYKRKNTKHGIIISEINSNKKMSLCL